MAGNRRIRVAVIFGGRSPEHSISCVSAGSVLAALDPDRYEVTAIGITREGRWVLAGDDPTRLAIAGGELPEVDTAGTAVALPGDPTHPDLVVLDPVDVPARIGAVDVVFPLLHGAYGEDGTLQGLLELAGVPYVGSGVLSSAVAMDKEYMKLLFSARGLPIGPYVVVRENDDVGAAVAGLDPPYFVKPARAGSSIGISRAADAGELDSALRVAWQHDPKALVEQAIAGREIECGVLEAADPGGAPEASLPAEVHVHRDFYDFAAKYLDDTTGFDIPAGLSPEVTARVQQLSVRAFTALSCESLARVDFFVQPGGGVLVNELNTMPGFTPASMFPRMWAASGLDYPTLVDRLIRSALRRRPGLR